MGKTEPTSKVVIDTKAPLDINLLKTPEVFMHESNWDKFLRNLQGLSVILAIAGLIISALAIWQTSKAIRVNEKQLGQTIIDNLNASYPVIGITLPGKKVSKEIAAQFDNISGNALLYSTYYCRGVVTRPEIAYARVYSDKPARKLTGYLAVGGNYYQSCQRIELATKEPVVKGGLVTDIHKIAPPLDLTVGGKHAFTFTTKGEKVNFVNLSKLIKNKYSELHVFFDDRINDLVKFTKVNNDKTVFMVIYTNALGNAAWAMAVAFRYNEHDMLERHNALLVAIGNQEKKALDLINDK